MFDIKLVRDNPEKIQKAAKDKKIDIDIKKILELDNKKREAQKNLQEIAEKRNKINKSITGKPTPEQIEEGKKAKEKYIELDDQYHALNEKLTALLLQIPNPAKEDVKIGKDESENDVVKTWGKPKKFDFKPLDHLELGKSLNIINVESAAKVSGSRFAYLKNDAALLEFALIQFAIAELTKEGFSLVIPPTMIKDDIMKGLGYMENGGEEDMFQLKEDGLFLVGTAEHSIVPMHKDDLINLKEMPKRYLAFSSAFRREAGSYGKDTRGILRVHQFDKLEMVSFVTDGKDDQEQEFLLSIEEKLFQALEIPYQVVKMCTGDLGFPAARKYDLEAWIPSQDKYREVTSVSTVTDFQSRRLNIKYTDGSEKLYAHVLNGTVFAIGRTLVAILENYQQEDGSIIIPKILQKYMGKEKISIGE